MRTLATAGLLSCITLLGGCVISVDNEGFIERVEKQFTVEGVAEVDLHTFDGRVEVRGWDRSDVLVEIEKRAEDKEAVDQIEILSDQTGQKINIDVKHSGRRGLSGFGSFTSPSARLIVSVPYKTNLTVRSGDGSLTIDRVEGKLELRTGDGSIRATETSGDLLVESGDGSLTLEDVTGRVEARTDDGTIRLSGVPTALRARSNDGSIVLRIRRGVVMSEDWMVATGDGSISAELPDDLNAMIEAEPRGSRARSELNLTEVSGGTSDQPTLRGRLGSGGKTLVLRTGDGRITLTPY